MRLATKLEVGFDFATEVKGGKRQTSEDQHEDVIFIHEATESDEAKDGSRQKILVLLLRCFLIFDFLWCFVDSEHRVDLSFLISGD